MPDNIEGFTTGSDEGWVICGGCHENMPAREQYGHLMSCKEAQNMAQVVKLLRLGRERAARTERVIERERAREERRLARERGRNPEGRTRNE